MSRNVTLCPDASGLGEPRYSPAKTRSWLCMNPLHHLSRVAQQGEKRPAKPSYSVRGPLVVVGLPAPCLWRALRPLRIRSARCSGSGRLEFGQRRQPFPLEGAVEVEGFGRVVALNPRHRELVEVCVEPLVLGLAQPVLPARRSNRLSRQPYAAPAPAAASPRG